MSPCRLLPAALIALLFLAQGLLRSSAPDPARDRPRPVAGVWTATWENSLGETGDELWQVHEETGGQLRAVLTWPMNGPVYRVEMRGERLRLDAIWVEGRMDGGPRYSYIGRFEGDELVLHYSVQDPNGKRWFGVSRLTRLRK
jgi:hypothetical protein